MKKRSMILADSDERYLKEISYFFMENVPQFELIIFTQKEKMFQYLEQSGGVDVLAVDESFANPELKERFSDMTRIVLSAGMNPLEGFHVVKKYQRMEELSKAILLIYAEEHDTPETIRGTSETKIAAFYSPAGGTGKTTLALSMAAAGARMGLRVLYLNLEEIDSVKDILGKTPGSLSEVFLALKTKGMNAGIKLKGCVGCERSAGFYYVSGVESVSEYEEMDGSDMGNLLKKVRELADYELVIVDLSSGFTDKTREILKEADRILVPMTMEEGSLSKMNRFLEESRLHDKYEPLFQKVQVVLNKMGASGSGLEALPDEVRNRLVCCASIMQSPVLAKRGEILRAGDRLVPVMSPLFQAVMGVL